MVGPPTETTAYISYLLPCATTSCKLVSFLPKTSSSLLDQLSQAILPINLLVPTGPLPIRSTLTLRLIQRLPSLCVYGVVYRGRHTSFAKLMFIVASIFDPFEFQYFFITAHFIQDRLIRLLFLLGCIRPLL